MKPFTIFPALCILVTLSGCLSRETKTEMDSMGNRGHLVIAGGSTNPDNRGIYRAVLEKLPTDGLLVILPTASGIPESSGPGTVEDFSAYKGERSVELIEITHETPERANDPVYTSGIDAADGVFFTGGDQSRILAAFRPDAGDAIGMTSLGGILAGGGVISGTSAGAAMMSDPMIRWGNSAEALLIGESDAPDRGVGVTGGMGFFPFGLVDQHFWERGRIGRLAAAMRSRSIDLGWGINENRAIDVDLAAAIIRPVGGQQGVIVVDRRQARDEGKSQHNLRLSLLGTGDVMHAKTGAITLYPGRVKYEPTDELIVKVDGDLWNRGVFQEFFTDYLSSTTRVVEITQDGMLHRFTRDESSIIAAPPGGGTETISAVNIRWDIIETDEAGQAARDILEEIVATP